MGHTSLLEALAAPFSAVPSSTLLPMSSRASVVLAGLLDVCELNESELSEGDSRLALRRWWAGGCGDTAGDRLRPLPSTRPPPRDLPEVMFAGVEESCRCSWAAWRRALRRWRVGPGTLNRDVAQGFFCRAEPTGLGCGFDACVAPD